MIQVTISRWVKAISGKMGNPIAKIDIPRIRATFDKLEAEREGWPAPKHFTDALVSFPRPQRESLDEPQMDDQTRERNKAMLSQLMATIGD